MGKPERQQSGLKSGWDVFSPITTKSQKERKKTNPEQVKATEGVVLIQRPFSFIFSNSWGFCSVLQVLLIEKEKCSKPNFPTQGWFLQAWQLEKAGWISAAF